MLAFEQTVRVPEGEGAGVSVFVDKEKGHVVYLSHSRVLVVVESNKEKGGAMRAAGFALGADSCSGCDGC